MNKTIHYIWLGKKKKPLIIRKCIKSWKKYFPDWEIKEWNETNLDLNSIKYAKDAYDAKKYAFASDAFRFEILCKEGGLYFDTDVKVVKPFDDLIDKYKAFVGYEYRMAAPGLVLYAAEPQNEIIKKMVDIYRNLEFVQQETAEAKVVGDYFSEVLEDYGFVYENKFQICGDFAVFPNEFFCPVDGHGNKLNYTNNTRSVHLYAGSWLPWHERYVLKIKTFIYKIIGYDRVQAYLNKK